ncbi:uncharacterized protein UV8b_07014 [Ustilaginoidea virens]|uniref:Uncharacterized protein n=1 Tax=Ustilaginoidea virens TaxID=1159556 RepID=A0A8E5MJM4_USTVR|nr:uncharacterized protein UV8b_07014 [Ustilaginoidea virens]QUC22773.1 hypothetical protein UV8b_07014 [Ustilaginoidea virens]
MMPENLGRPVRDLPVVCSDRFRTDKPFLLQARENNAAEVAPREDDNGRPLPTADLMGYHSLGIVFGPLLVGDSLDRYTMKVVTPSSGMLLFPLSPPKFRRDRRKSQQADTKASGPPTVDKILVANNITQMLIANWRDVVRQMRSLGTHYRKDSSLLDFPAKNDDLQDSEGLGERPEEIMDAVPGLRHASRPQEPSTGRQGAQTRKSTTLRKTASRKVLPKLSMATLSPTKEESMGDDESSDSSNKRESAIERLQKTEGSDTRKKEVIGHVDCKSRPESRKLSNEQSARGKVINTSGHSHAPESLKSATSPPVYVENVPPRESSRCQTSQDETKKASLQNDNVEGNILPFASATTDLLNSCNQDRGQVESQNGSEGPQNSAFPQTPKQRWHPPSWSANGTSTNPGGIRVVQKSPTVTSAACATQDQAVQCNLSPKKARSRSIDTTPERFYAMKREPSRILDSSADDVFSGQQKHGCRQKKPFLLHGPRLSKSYENFSSQTRITLESPTNSTKSKDLGKNGSVRAMAAMFDVQPSGLGSSAMTGDEQATMANSVRDGDRNSKSDSALTRRTAFLLDTTQRPVSTTGTTRNGNDRFDEVMGDVMEKQSVADSINHSASLDSETDGICQPSTPGDKATAKADLDEADSRRIRMMPSLGRMGPYPEQPPIAHHLSLTRPPSSPSPMMESEADSILDAIPLPQVARSGSATVLYSQIRKLQRQLNSKTEEAAQLRRQLAAQQDSDVGTVSEQLRQAKRDAAMWKERAEAAERRVKVFEKFTEKLKKIRDELADAKKYEKGDGDGKDGDGRARVADATIKAVDRLRLLQGQSAKKEPGNPDDCSDGTAQTRKRPHDVVKSQDGAVDRSRPASDSPAGEEGGKLGSRGGMEVRMRRRSDQIWAAAEELLQMEEDGVE